ncbi:hypothetical protein GCM10011360_12380 [Primorskyibacter flagellatus]|uniref:Uncharacterized protein n=1 Tax=Primorskyibacter flagellatus TaxID=1387277 RepID=A0A917EEH4_9RHOB|nr:hypothetical protein [Primorskyibacter flagellatus]GGE25497.1 hypothetical protein GCM10011360_12380 [Primorskyibacter flagellatus]
MSKTTAARAAANARARVSLTSSTAQIQQVKSALSEAARQITQGETWVLPYLKRLKAELARLEDDQDLLLQAHEIANAAPRRAA